MINTQDYSATKLSPKIILSTLNSTYQHPSFGLRYLKANLLELEQSAEIIEFTIAQNPKVIVEKILLKRPLIVGFGVYIWNTDETLQVIQILKKIAPEICIVLGGPEISYETDSQAHTQFCDYIITGEADFEFYHFCKKFLNNEKPSNKIIRSETPEISKIKMPYHLYSDEDIKNRIIYVEASRGCPYKCEYCLSSLDKSVRNYEINSFLTEMQSLIDKGVREFKFVDRTFNLSPTISNKIMNFFLERIDLNLFLHFEMVPDRLPEELKELIKKFPKGSLQFEVGIQTLNEEVSKNVSRRQNVDKIKENFQFLRTETFVHTHADLIVGLPGETLTSFKVGFDKLISFDPDEIQVGILKRLKGTPIIRHDFMFKMIYNDQSPYEIIQNKDMDFFEIQLMTQFSKFWDSIANSGQFLNIIKYLKKESLEQNQSFFDLFMELTQFLNKRHSAHFGISLLNLTESVYEFLKYKLNNIKLAEKLIMLDYCGYFIDEQNEKRFVSESIKVRDLPPFLKKLDIQKTHGTKNSRARQNRHNTHTISLDES